MPLPAVPSGVFPQPPLDVQRRSFQVGPWTRLSFIRAAWRRLAGKPLDLQFLSPPFLPSNVPPYQAGHSDLSRIYPLFGRIYAYTRCAFKVGFTQCLGPHSEADPRYYEVTTKSDFLLGIALRDCQLRLFLKMAMENGDGCAHYSKFSNSQNSRIRIGLEYQQYLDNIPNWIISPHT